MTTRHQQEVVRQWLQGVSAANYLDEAQFATWALEWIAELARQSDPKQRGPMMQIRARGPISISEIKEDN